MTDEEPDVAGVYRYRCERCGTEFLAEKDLGFTAQHPCDETTEPPTRGIAQRVD